jgi:tellurite resistance protein
MQTTWASVLGWAREAAGGEASSVDEPAAEAAVERAKQASAAAIALAESVAADVKRERAESDRKQAVFDAAYMIAAADGVVTAEERAKMKAILGAFFGETLDESSIDDGLDMARVLLEHGGVAAAESIARAVPETDGRASILVLASAIGWLGGGVGTKEGLVLQAMARAFGVSLADLHRLMAVGKVV